MVFRLVWSFARLLENRLDLQCAAFLVPIGHHMDDLLSKFANNNAAADAMTFVYPLNMEPKLMHKVAAILHPIQDEAFHDNRRI